LFDRTSYRFNYSISLSFYWLFSLYLISLVNRVDCWKWLHVVCSQFDFLRKLKTYSCGFWQLIDGDSNKYIYTLNTILQEGRIRSSAKLLFTEQIKFFSQIASNNVTSLCKWSTWEYNSHIHKIFFCNIFQVAFFFVLAIEEIDV
jgi:hypothetical protein